MEVHLQVLSLFGTKNLAQQFYVEGQPPFDFLNQVHCFVPCTLFQGEISLERPYQSQLHCFERAVLELLALSHRNVQTLADMLCFPDPSFIRLLLSDLGDRGYIDGRNRLTEKGKMILEKTKTRALEEKKAVATFFQNTLTGTLLPYVHIAQSNQDSVEKQFTSCTIQARKEGKEGKEETGQTSQPPTSGKSLKVNQKKLPQELSFSCGTAGEKEVICGRVLSPTVSEERHPPTSREAGRLLREYKQYTQNTLQSTGKSSAWEISSQYLGDSLHLTPLYQTGYFHLQGGKINGDADTLIISDGFLPSLVDMVHYLEEHESQWVQLFHESAIVARRWEEEETRYENLLYPQLLGRWMDSLSSLDGTKDREKALEATIRRGVIEMYGELEWALHYHFKEHPYSSTLLDGYRGHLPRENRVTLARIVEKSKLLEGEVDLISQFLGKTNLFKGAPTMTTLVPLLLISWDKGESTLLTRLQKKLPEFYRNLSYLHPIRNKAIHQGMCMLSFDEFISYQEFATGFLDIVLPDWKKRHFIRKQVNENNSDTNRRLAARKHLHEEFGFSYVRQHLTHEMVETLLQLAPENRQPSSTPEYIKALCLLLELSFAQSLEVMEGVYENSNQSPPRLSQVVEEIERRYNIKLPLSLTTVNQTPLELALSGRPSTLGAEVLAFLFLDTTGTGAYLVGNQGLRVIHHMITLRGHGNEQEVSSLLLEKNDLEGLRHCVVSIMKGLVTYGKKGKE